MYTEHALELAGVVQVEKVAVAKLGKLASRISQLDVEL